MSNIKELKVTKVTAALVGLAAGVMMLGLAPLAVSTAHGQTTAELQAQISSLLATIQALQAQLSGLSGGSGSSSCYVFTGSYSNGDSGPEVVEIQKFLNSSSDTQVASSGAGSPGNETAYYGSLTTAAVNKFQAKYSAQILDPLGLPGPTGYWGASSRAQANALVSASCVSDGGDGGGVVVPSGSGLTVSSTSQPAASLAPQSAARVPYTNFRVTASSDGAVTLNSVTVERGGLGNNAVFSGIVLLDENGQQLGLSRTLNSNNQATVGEAVVIPAGQTRTFTVAGNMAASLTAYAGQVVGLNVIAVNSSGTVSGSLPISGAAHTINATLSLGSVTVARGIDDPNSIASKEVGTTGYTFSAARLTAGSAEKVRVHSIRFNQSGSGSSSDLANVMVIFDGTTYTPVVSSDGKYYTASFGSGIVIDKGLNKELKIVADIESGSGRTIAFDVYRLTDVYVSGETFGYGITPTAGTGWTSSSNPAYDASVVTVSNGSMTVSKATSVSAQNIAVSVPNQPLGGFEVVVKGEAISVGGLVFNVLATGDEAENITNVSLVNQNGSVIAGPVDGVSGTTNSAHGTFTFSDTVTFPIGTSVVSLQGQLGSAFATNDTVVASTTPGSTSYWSSVRGEVTGNTITPSPATAITGNTMTVKAASVTIGTSASPVAQTVVAGASEFTFADYQFNATASGEDVRFTTLTPLLLVAGGNAEYLTGCQLWNGATALNTGSNTVDVSASTDFSSGADVTFTLDSGGVTIPKGTITNLSLKCNLSSSATGSDTFKWGMTTTQTGAGLVSGGTVSATASGAGQVMTAATGGSFTVAADSTSPSYKVASAGSTDVTLGVLRFNGQSESIDLKQVVLQLTNSASSTAADLKKVSLWDGSTMVGQTNFGPSETQATTTIAGFVIPKDGYKVMTIKGDFEDIGTIGAATQGHLIAVDYDGDAGTLGTYGNGSGGTITSGSTSDTALSGVRLFRSFPVLAKDSVPTNVLANGEQKLLRFKVTADSKGDVGIYKFTARIATTTATVTGLNIYAYMNSGYGDVVSGLSSDGGMLATDLVGTDWADSSTDLNFVAQTSGAANTVIQVPAGATRYFELRGTVAGTASGASVSAQIQGDSAYPSLAAFMDSATDLVGVTDDDFIWSPNATTTSLVSNVDWTNGYGVSGLPASNMTAEVLSK